MRPSLRCLPCARRLGLQRRRGAVRLGRQRRRRPERHRTIPALPVRDVRVAAAYYGERFGFDAPHLTDDFAVLARDDAVLHLWGATDAAWPDRSDLRERPVCSGAESFLAGTASCRIEVADVDALYTELAAAGVLHPIEKGGAPGATDSARASSPPWTPTATCSRSSAGRTHERREPRGGVGCVLQRLLPARLRRRERDAEARSRRSPRCGSPARRTAATCSTRRAASAATRSRSRRRATAWPGSTARRPCSTRRAAAPAARAGRSSSQADYRRLPFPDASFDAALNLFSSLGFLGDAEDTRALAEIGRTLRPGGRLVIEIMHRDLLVRIVLRAGLAAGRRGPAAARAAHLRPGRGIAQVTQTLVGERRVARVAPVLRPRLHGDGAARDARAAGFAEARCHGGFDGAPFAPDTRLVIVATR